MFSGPVTDSVRPQQATTADALSRRRANSAHPVHVLAIRPPADGLPTRQPTWPIAAHSDWQRQPFPSPRIPGVSPVAKGESPSDTVSPIWAETWHSAIQQEGLAMAAELGDPPCVGLASPMPHALILHILARHSSGKGTPRAKRSALLRSPAARHLGRGTCSRTIPCQWLKPGTSPRAGVIPPSISLHRLHSALLPSRGQLPYPS